MIKTFDLTDIMATTKIRNHDLFTTTELRIYDSGDSKGKGYAKPNQKVYVGSLAKEVLTLNLIEGLNGGEIYNRLNLKEDKEGFIIGNTLVAHRIASAQTGALKGVSRAKELLEEYIDYIESTYSPF